MGEGAFGKVYGGTYDGEPVAVKELNKQELMDKRGENMLDYELKIYELKIEHQNILKFYGHI